MDLGQISQFENAIEWYLDHLKFERGASEHTLASYSGDLRRSAEFLSGRGRSSWEEITAEDLTLYQTAARHGSAVSTARRRVSALRSFLKFLKQQGAGPSVELPSAAGMRLPRRVPKALPGETLDALLAAPDIKTPTGLRDRALMELVYGTGLRVSETVGLRMEELNLDLAAIRVTGKRGKTRIVPIPALTLPWIEKYLAEGRSKLVKRATSALFLGARGAPLSRQSAGIVIEQYRKAAGIPGHVSPHTLRHTYAVHLLKGGADLRAVQELLGHASISTTQVYTQLDMDHVQQAYEKAHPRR